MQRVSSKVILGLGAAFFLFSASPALANTTNKSTSPTYAAQPFSFYCNPYIRSFEEDKHYKPTDGPCLFTVPSAIAGTKVISIFKGVPGASTFVAGDQVFASPTLVQEDNVVFGTPLQDQDYFSVIYGGSSLTELSQFQAAFATGSTTGTLLPSDNYRLIKWKWGGKPVSEYDPVIIIPGILGSWEKNGEWVIDPILHTYDNLIDTFLANGYIEGQTLFRFGYDWERPNEITAHVLAGKIAEIKTICGCSRVDIVAHSMGGLVALYYIENSEYADDVDQLFLVATPLMGAPKAYKTWEGGEVDFGDDRQNAFMQTLFYLEARKNGHSSIFDYIRNKPIESIHELLPAYTDYLYDSSYTIITTPTNGFLETLLQKLGTVNNKVRIQPILADNGFNNTTSGFVTKPSTQLPKWEHGEPTQTFFDAGDGTVTRASIENIFGIVEKEFMGVNHTNVVATSSGYIFEQLNSKIPSVIINKTYNAAISFLFLKLFSPIDMQIVAPDGKRLGKDFATNTEVDEIPDAFYSGFGTDNEYAVILNPLPGDYKIKTVGTGSGGEYTIVTNYSDITSSTLAEVTSSTTQAQIIDHTLYVSSTSTAVTLIKDIPPPPPLPPPPPPVTLTTDTCLADMQEAYLDKWIPKKHVYKKLMSSCKALKNLLETRDEIEQVPLASQTKAQKAHLVAVYKKIGHVLDHMDLLAKDKTNTAEGVELIHKYTSWFRDHELHL